MKTLSANFILTLLLLPVTPAVAEDDHHGHAHGGHGHGHGHESEHVEPARGPHGGRLLEDEDFALEITIFEDGVPPQYRIFPFRKKNPVDPKDVSVTVELARFGGKRDLFQLTPKADYLTSDKEVSEPHSFVVSVSASADGKQYKWQYESFEGRTELNDQALAVANISVETAGPREIASISNVYGRFLPNQDRTAHIAPRFPGVVRAIHKQLGDRVERGDVLAIVESNQSLQPFEVRSQISGEVLSRHATIGEFVSDGKEIFVVADLSEIWADFQVYRDDFEQIHKGQGIKVDIGTGTSIEATVHYVSPVTDEATQSKLIRAVLPNPEGKLRPGLFVSGTLSSAVTKVPLAVHREAIQTFRDWNVVYLTDGHVFQAMPVELGRRDSRYVEILAGISEGDRYVARNSFIIKADVEKSGASHDH